jgi:enamine deaminase RidA (YjgF/YER057c/UK114 family)
MHMADAAGSPSGSDPLGSVLPEGWSRPKGYAQAVRVPPGRALLFVAGQVGWDTDERLVSDDFTAQFEQALRNCVTIVEAGGGAASDIVRLTMYCADRTVYAERQREVGEAYRRVMGRHFPAMSLVEVAALLEEGAQIEIEATAAVPDQNEWRTG